MGYLGGCHSRHKYCLEWGCCYVCSGLFWLWGELVPGLGGGEIVIGDLNRTLSRVINSRTQQKKTVLMILVSSLRKESMKLEKLRLGNDGSFLSPSQRLGCCGGQLRSQEVASTSFHPQVI